MNTKNPPENIFLVGSCNEVAMIPPKKEYYDYIPHEVDFKLQITLLESPVFWYDRTRENGAYPYVTVRALNAAMSIKHVLFDADGVVIWPQMEFSRHLATVHNITPQMTREFFNGRFNDCLAGKADLREVLPPFLKQWGWKISLDAFIETWMVIDSCVDERLLTMIQDLRRSGFRCGLATSQEQNRAAYMRNQMGFRRFFDDLFFSCELGCVKPERAYYRAIQEKLQVDGAEILFWDDNKQNVTAAQKAGWNAEVYLSFRDFEQAMQLLLC